MNRAEMRRARDAPRRPPPVSASAIPSNFGNRIVRQHWSICVPGLKVLHHAIDGDLIEKYEVADANIVMARHRSLFLAYTARTRRLRSPADHHNHVTNHHARRPIRAHWRRSNFRTERVAANAVIFSPFSSSRIPSVPLLIDDGAL